MLIALKFPLVFVAVAVAALNEPHLNHLVFQIGGTKTVPPIVVMHVHEFRLMLPVSFKRISNRCLLCGM